MLDQLKTKGYEIIFESHAVAILDQDFPSALGELETVLNDFSIPITEIIGSGGGETKGTQRLRRALAAKGWRKTIFEVRKSIRVADADVQSEPVQIERESTTHEIDHVKAFSGGHFAWETSYAFECSIGTSVTESQVAEGAWGFSPMKCS